ncbi:MAG: DUF4954 family protein [Treponema sp.]|nr:DUF4954 family protein [Treponema sp.]
MAFVSNSERFGYDFIPPECIPHGKDEYWIRNEQTGQGKAWRALKKEELEILIQNSNSCSNWDEFLVNDPFDPSLIRNSLFYGLVRVGALRNTMLQFHDYCVPTGIKNSTIISCDIGDDTAIQDCAYLSHYIIGDNCILSHIDEMQTTNFAKFGNGAVKDGEGEEYHIWIDVMNEAGGRSILPFQDMLPADAFLWASYRDDKMLVEKLKNITQKDYGGPRGTYGMVGSHSVIRGCGIIKDVFVGEWAYIKGANQLKNISVLSTKEEPSKIGEGVEMVNGIVGPGSSAFYGVKAIRFVMGRCTNLKYGARLIHSVLGDNSTVSCCEILNNLVFPVHEQHHNNSFLIASLVQGMSNMAAGATVGSNHNSRANDGEIRAGRGFWPGLATTLKHPCRFASFTLVAKGDYPYELNITLPFSLVNNNSQLDRLEVMPAYFWMYNLYALERNSWKAGARDKRKIKKQHIETDYLAPDTAEEIIAALSQMEHWMRASGMSGERAKGKKKSHWVSGEPHGHFSKDNEDPEYYLHFVDNFVKADGLERHSRNSVILKPSHAWAAYHEMLLYYALKTLADYLVKEPLLSYPDFVNQMEAGGDRVSEWVNLGGQIVPAFRVDELRGQIRSGEIDSWDGIHAAYGRMAEAYSSDRAHHAWEVYRYLEKHPSSSDGKRHPLHDPAGFREELEILIHLRQLITEQVFRSRAKDFENPFQSITYRNKEEMEEVIGTAENNSFTKLVREQAKLWEDSIKELSVRLGKT